MEFKVGQIFSETSYYKVDEILSSGDVALKTDDGSDIVISKKYLEMYASCGDVAETEEKKTMTELSEIVLANPRTAMTVVFFKKDQEKSKKVFEKEKADMIEKIQSASLKNAAELLNDLIENPISRIIKGEKRTLRGRHEGHVDNLGRIHFIDMDIKRDETKPDYDSRKREVDPRTIQSVIVNNVRYVLK